ncbi:MAG: TolC family protein [Gammaproteobacteria bacterium]|nr:TolC family protein [Gammaproteobacteria bacterium]
MSVIQTLSRLAGISLIVLAGASSVRADTELTLAEAERLTLAHAPWLAHHRTNVDAAAERAVYEGRLPDPQLVVGAINVPTDTWKLNQEDMTMSMVGIRQSFPPGDTLALKSRRAEKELTREESKVEAERRNLLRQVRQAWLELYFQQESLRLLQESRRLQQKQLDAAEGRYRAAADMQQSVIRARQAVARVNEREPMLKAQIARTRAQLGRWIGEAAMLPLPVALPTLAVPAPNFDATRHPEWLATEAMFDAARLEVDMARQDYKPAWMLDLSYGFRRPMPDGTERPNMVTAMVTLDLPVFRAKRQDRRLAEKQALETGARLETEDRRRELEAMYTSMRAEYEALAARAKIFEEQLLPAIRRETQVTVAGFARDQAEYRDARMKALEAEQEYMRLRVDLAKTQAELLYLTGE